MTNVKNYDLSTAYGRHIARKNGLAIPIYKPYGLKPKKDFWSLVNVKEKNDCWIWTGKLNKNGYGRIRYEGFYEMAHRVAYKLKTGIDIKNLIAMHICDNPSCCNPNHICIGTHADNQNDKVKKNRQAKGEKIGTSLLTNEQVLEARKKYKPYVVTYQMLAKEYGVSKDTIQKAVRGIYWKHL